MLALSWSPQYCATAGKPSEFQCNREQPYGFVVHGLWPQFERGFPSNCNKAPYLPQPLIDRLLPIMPSKGLILHEWKTHGTCSGLEAQAYVDRIEATYRGLRIPDAYRHVDKALSLKPSAFEAALIAANPQLKPDGISLQCRGPYLAEVRICFDTAGAPRQCGPDLDDRCGKTLMLRPAGGRLVPLQP
ncbi:ribonuclease T2 family protein [Hydrocarboniphaga sp.]|uniref:ribonuclease T2 family protein n=1 Tax=Hydrocarboniphaga sp. TaxID=2033016 RepID=UPI003D11F6FD